MCWTNELDEHTLVMFLYIPTKLHARRRRKARRVRTAQTARKYAPWLAKDTCRAFRGIFRFFLVNPVGMHCLMRLYAFLRGKLHASDVRQRRSANRGGGVTCRVTATHHTWVPGATFWAGCERANELAVIKRIVVDFC